MGTRERDGGVVVVVNWLLLSDMLLSLWKQWM